jgi:hypothetical protein
MDVKIRDIHKIHTALYLLGQVIIQLDGGME